MHLMGATSGFRFNKSMGFHESLLRLAGKLNRLVDQKVAQSGNHKNKILPSPGKSYPPTKLGAFNGIFQTPPFGLNPAWDVSRIPASQRRRYHPWPRPLRRGPVWQCVCVCVSHNRETLVYLPTNPKDGTLKQLFPYTTSLTPYNDMWKPWVFSLLLASHRPSGTSE